MYTAQIRIQRDGVQVYQEAKSFARKPAAKAWARKRETELDEPGAIERASRKGATLKEMTDRYLVEVEKARPTYVPQVGDWRASSLGARRRPPPRLRAK